MIKIKPTKPKKMNGRYFIMLPKHLVERLGIDEDTKLELVVDVYNGRVWNKCKMEWS